MKLKKSRLFLIKEYILFLQKSSKQVPESALNMSRHLIGLQKLLHNFLHRHRIVDNKAFTALKLPI